MHAELHHLHAEIAKVCPITGISGDINKQGEARVDNIHYLGNVTDAQKKAAAAVIKSFDANRKYDPDPDAFLDDLAQSDKFSDAQYMAVHRALRISDEATRVIYAVKNLKLDDDQKKQLAALCKTHCITL